MKHHLFVLTTLSAFLWLAACGGEPESSLGQQSQRLCFDDPCEEDSPGSPPESPTPPPVFDVCCDDVTMTTTWNPVIFCWAICGSPNCAPGACAGQTPPNPTGDWGDASGSGSDSSGGNSCPKGGYEAMFDAQINCDEGYYMCSHDCFCCL